MAPDDPKARLNDSGEAAGDDDGRSGLRPELSRQLRNAIDMVDWHSEGIEEAFAATGNPIYVWEAIAVVLGPEFRRFYGQHPKLAIPMWCLDYLYSSSENVMRFAAMLRSPGGEPWPVEKGAPFLRAREALKRLPQALGFSSAGWNAFKAYRSDRAHDYLLDTFEDARARDESKRAAMDRLVKLAQVDEPSVRRLLAKRRRQRRLRSKPPS